MNFRINLTQFYVDFLRQEHQKDVLYVSFNAWDFQVSSYTPFHFSFTVDPFKDCWVMSKTGLILNRINWMILALVGP